MFLLEQRELRLASLAKFDQLNESLEVAIAEREKLLAEANARIEKLEKEIAEIGSPDKIREELAEIQELIYQVGLEERPQVAVEEVAVEEEAVEEEKVQENEQV